MLGSFAGDEELGDEAGREVSTAVVWAKEFNRQKSNKIKAVMIFIILGTLVLSDCSTVVFGYINVFNFLKLNCEKRFNCNTPGESFL